MTLNVPGKSATNIFIPAAAIKKISEDRYNQEFEKFKQQVANDIYEAAKQGRRSVCYNAASYKFVMLQKELKKLGYKISTIYLDDYPYQYRVSW